MLQCGTAELKLNRGRIALPARWRPAFTDPLVLGCGDEKELALCRADQVEQVIERIKQVAMSPVEGRAFARLLLGTAVDIMLDGRGRLTLPHELCGLAGISDEVLLVGQGDWIELWSPERWYERLEWEFTLPASMVWPSPDGPR